MAYGIQNYDGTKIGIDFSYPDGDIKDDTGSNNGTRVNRKSNADLQQFFAKLMRLAEIIPNGLPDNEYVGFQFVEAAAAIFRRFGEYVRFDRSVSISVSGVNSPCIEVLAGSPNSGDILLEDSTSAEFDAGIVVVLNKSSNPVDLYASGSDTINGGASYALASGARIEIVQSKVGAKWEIVSLT